MKNKFLKLILLFLVIDLVLGEEKSNFIKSFLSPQASIEKVQLSIIKNKWSYLSETEKKVVLYKFLEVIGKYFIKTYPDLFNNAQDNLEKSMLHAFSIYGEIISFVLNNTPIYENNSLQTNEYEKFFIASNITESLVSQINNYGKILNNDNFEFEKVVNLETFETGMFLSGNIRELQYPNTEKNFYELKIRNHSESSTGEMLFFCDKEKDKNPSLDEKVFVFFQTPPKSSIEIINKLSTEKKFSFMELLKIYGIKGKDLEEYQFERSNVFIKENGSFLSKNAHLKFTGQLNHDGTLISVGEQLGIPQSLLQSSKPYIVNHVHPNGDYFLSDADILYTYSLGLIPIGVLNSNGNGKLYIPLFDNSENSEGLNKLKKHQQQYMELMIILKNENKQLKDLLGINFLSIFYKILDYKLPQKWLKTKINNMCNNQLTKHSS